MFLCPKFSFKNMLTIVTELSEYRCLLGFKNISTNVTESIKSM